MLSKVKEVVKEVLQIDNLTLYSTLWKFTPSVIKMFLVLIAFSVIGTVMLILTILLNGIS